jgi:malonyl-CoA O-methyltransferase
MNDDSARLRTEHLRRRFDRAASTFDTADYVHRVTCDGLLERLDPIIVKPRLILDLGSATGAGSRVLARRFRKSRVVSLDISAGMLRASAEKKPMFSRIREVRGDARQLPLQAGSVDMVFANMILPWVDDLPSCFAEIGRVLRKGGLFTFATLGTGSAIELRESWETFDERPHLHRFPDMHDLGDALMRSGLGDPVLDVDRLVVKFPGLAELERDLDACGGRNCLQARRQTLTGKNRYRAMQQRFLALGDGAAVPLELELVYGHAWGRGQHSDPSEYRIDAESIGRFMRP